MQPMRSTTVAHRLPRANTPVSQPAIGQTNDPVTNTGGGENARARFRQYLLSVGLRVAVNSDSAIFVKVIPEFELINTRRINDSDSTNVQHRTRTPSHFTNSILPHCSRQKVTVLRTSTLV